MPKIIHTHIAQTRLSDEDFHRLIDLAKEKQQTQSDLTRQAIKWYLANHDKLRNDSANSELSLTLQNMTNRICGMLARQGVQLGTLFELAWENHADHGMQDKFVSAANTVKNKMRVRLTEDERALAEKMRKVVGDGNSA